MIRFQRPPTTDDELHAAVLAVFGVDIPRVKVCENHVAPFTAFSHAFFAKEPNTALWYGSRGVGKSYLLALLGLSKTVFHMCSTTILGGSIHQSNNVFNHMASMMRSENAPTELVTSFTKTQLLFNNYTTVTPLSASPTSVRGPHPTLHCLDEIDEMDYGIYVSSLGQALRQKNALGVEIDEYVVKSSTWQHLEGCVLVGTEIITGRGTVPIEQVVVGDVVPTGDGWRPVSHIHDTGDQECVRITFASGAELVCTPWHPVWTSSGWTEASLLAPGALALRYLVPMGAPVPRGRDLDALVAPPLAAADDVGALVPVLADRLRSPVLPGTGLVDGCGDRLQMPGIDAGGVPAQMVDLTIGERAVNLPPHPSVGEHDSLGEGSVGLSAVPLRVLVERPDDAVVGVEVDGYIFSDDEVVSVTHAGILLPTRDLSVDGCHEYVASGVLVHNTFSKVMEEHKEKYLPCFTFCYKEVLKPHGWMDPEFIERKRRTIPDALFKLEYDLGLPTGETSVFDMQRLSEVFFDIPEIPALSRHSMNNNLWVYEAPRTNGIYALGADLAKSKDWTVAVVARVDVTPMRIVAVKKVGRIPWPSIVQELKDLKRMFNDAEMGHDGTGLGSVVTDLLEGYSRKYLFIGEQRKKLLNEMIANVENFQYRFPHGNTLYDKFRATKIEDVWSTTLINSHLPDESAAMAVLNAVCGRSSAGVEGRGVKKKDTDVGVYTELMSGALTRKETLLFDEWADDPDSREVFTISL